MFLQGRVAIVTAGGGPGIGTAVLYLVGPYSERETGTVMHVNGGSYYPA